MPRNYKQLGRPEVPHYGIVAAGELGQGKTVLSLSYTPNAWPADQPVNRLVIDEECRTVAYRAQRAPWSLDHDDPTRLLFTFNYFPGYLEKILPEDFLQLYRAVKTNDWSWWPYGKPDVFVVDNWGHFQGLYSGWMHDKAFAIELAALAGLTTNYSTVLVVKKWQPPDPGWWSMIKTIAGQFFIDMRAAGISWVVNSLLHNVWENFGAKGYAADGKPIQRILGRSATIYTEVLTQADASWLLDRKLDRKLLAKPRISLDYFAPKASIPGVPPIFVWDTWETLWRYEHERAIPTGAAWNQIEQQDIPLDSEEAYVERQVEGKKRLGLVLVPQYYASGAAIRAALATLGYDDYDPDQHDVLQAKLIELANAAKVA